jgi:hypothetical protein
VIIAKEAHWIRLCQKFISKEKKKGNRLMAGAGCVLIALEGAYS